MAWGTVQDVCHCMPEPQGHTRVLALLLHLDKVASLALMGKRSWQLVPDVSHVLVPADVQDTKTSFCQEPQAIWVYSSFPAAALRSPSRDVPVLDRLSFPGSRRWIYRQPIIRWLGRCFPPLPAISIQGVTDTLLPIPWASLCCCFPGKAWHDSSLLFNSKEDLCWEGAQSWFCCCQEGVEASGGCAGSLRHPGMLPTPAGRLGDGSTVLTYSAHPTGAPSTH